ncbi:MAG TPA: patatin-like phospholipase family protein [Acetobacteraceae bacterium]|nr:patatin-like phospholipase family protein [Acetobacteraceae bacterium]
MAIWNTQERRLALALQGGGSFGAFTWGVLDRLLEDHVEFDAISGASAGAVNAVLLASGMQRGGPKGARAALTGFWTDVARAPGLPPFMLSALAASAQFLSPYTYPLNLNPMRDLLVKHVDFERLRQQPPMRLFIAATRVRDGSPIIFRESKISLDVVLASACLPLLHRAVEIDGEVYWDGAFSANPPLRRLAIETAAEDILLVEIMPEEEEKVPHSSSEITQRAQMITFNASLQHELQALEDLRASCNGTKAVFSPICRKLRRQHLYRLAATDSVEDLSLHSMMDTSAALLRNLHDAGRDAASAWLAREETEQAA